MIYHCLVSFQGLLKDNHVEIFFSKGEGKRLLLGNLYDYLDPSVTFNSLLWFKGYFLALPRPS